MKTLLLLIFSLFLSYTYGKNYVVFGNNKLYEAIKSVKKGDTITMRNGIWTNVNIQFNSIGTKTQPILLQAESIGKVFLEGSSKMRISGKHQIVSGLVFRNGYIDSTDHSVIKLKNGSDEAHYCRITNCSILNYNPPSIENSYKYISIYGKHNRVDHCHFEGKTNIGATLVIWTDTIPDYHKIDFNYFGPRPLLKKIVEGKITKLNGGESIRFGTSKYSLSSSNSIVENNLFYKCNGEIEIISNKSSNNIYRNNTFIHCKGTLTLRHGNNCTVNNNFFFGEKGVKDQGGIRIIGENHVLFNNYFQDLDNGSSNLRGAIVIMTGLDNNILKSYARVKNALISNNTFINCKTSLIIGAEKQDTFPFLYPQNCFITNNIFYSDLATNSFIKQIHEPNNFIYVSNIAYGKELGINPPQEGFRIIDPIFDSKNKLWKLSEQSPAINKGSSINIENIITSDFEGQKRNDSKIDVGCDEFTNNIENKIFYKPLSTNDVGPISLPNSFGFYPKPISDTLLIIGKNSIINMQIISQNGIVLLHTNMKFSKNTILLNELHEDIYFLKINNNDWYKLIKVKED